MAQSIATSDHNQGFAAAFQAGFRRVTAVIVQTLSTSYRNLHDRLDKRIVTEIDVDKVAAELDVVARGASDGSAGQPPPLEQEATGTQREVVAHFRGLLRRAQKKVVLATEKLEALGNSVDVQRTVTEIREIPAECESELLRLASRWRPELDKARGVTARQAVDEASAPEVTESVHQSPLKYALFAVAVIFGTAFVVTNLALQGVSMPADWALGISALAVLAPFVLAREIHRYSLPEHRQHRAMAHFGMALSVTFIVVLGVVTAVYISAFLAGENPDINAVLNTLSTSLIGIALAPQGWVGAATIIVAGMLSIGLGRNSAESSPATVVVDPVPRSGEDPMPAIAARMRKQYNRIVDQADRRITTKVENARKQVRRYCRLLDESKSGPGEIEEYCVVLEDACNIVLDRYRAANRAARKLDDPPSFSSHVCFRPEDESSGRAFEAADQLRADLLQSLEQLDREASGARQKLRDLNGRALSAVGSADFYTGKAQDDDLI
jgi:hypothetical protein